MLYSRTVEKRKKKVSYSSLASQTMLKKFVSRRGLCAIALVVLLSPSLMLPVSGFYLSDSDLGQGVLGFLRSLESTVEKKTIWFYRHFGRNVDPSKIDHVRLCDYGDDSNSKFCSPAHNPVVPYQNPNLPKGVSVKNNPLSKQNRSSFTSIPVKCLEDPDTEGCRDLRTLGGIDDIKLPGIGSTVDTNGSGVDSSNGFVKLNEEDETTGVDETPTLSPNDVTFVTDEPTISTPPIGAIASDAPTKFICYGNHDSFKKAGSRDDEMTNVRGNGVNPKCLR